MTKDKKTHNLKNAVCSFCKTISYNKWIEKNSWVCLSCGSTWTVKPETGITPDSFLHDKASKSFNNFEKI